MDIEVVSAGTSPMPWSMVMEGQQAHHGIPQAVEKDMPPEINIRNPKYGRTIPSTEHNTAEHKEFVKVWQEFMQPRRTAGEVEDFFQKTDSRYFR